MAMCANSLTCHITAAQAGQRLDVAVGLLFPEYSARARRRLWDSHRVLVNGKACPCGCMVQAGDEICACPIAEQPAGASTPPLSFQPWLAGEQAPHIVAEQQNLLFLYKPSGLHSAALAGRGGPNLEALLPDLLPQERRSEQPYNGADAVLRPTAAQAVRLVNRLDCGTSGLVVAARDAFCAAQWQSMENAGLCEKHYLALLCGRLSAPIVVRNNLDMDSRRVTKVLPTESTHPLRHSRFTPVGTLSSAALHALWAACSVPRLASSLWPDPQTALHLGLEPNVYTVALCTIAKGARHQIRAHASHAGFPLWGDSLYAATRHGTQGPPPAPSHRFLLHHGRLVLSGAVIQCLPVWFPLLPPDIQEAVRALWHTAI